MNRKSFDYVGADVVERAARGDIEDVSASFWLLEHDLQVAFTARRRRHLSLETKGVLVASASTVEGYTRSIRFRYRGPARSLLCTSTIAFFTHLYQSDLHKKRNFYRRANTFVRWLVEQWWVPVASAVAV